MIASEARLRMGKLRIIVPLTGYTLFAVQYGAAPLALDLCVSPPEAAAKGPDQAFNIAGRIKSEHSLVRRHRWICRKSTMTILLMKTETS